MTPRLEETVVIALAAGRVARAISVDAIAEPVRALADRRAAGSGRRADEFVAELLRCPVCVGWWTSLAMSLAWPGRMRLRRGLAVAGAQVLMTLAERLVSEQGRAAIHEADLVQGRNQAAA